MPRYWVILLETGEILREFDSKDIACHFSEQVFMIGKRKNKCIDSLTGKIESHFE